MDRQVVHGIMSGQKEGQVAVLVQAAHVKATMENQIDQQVLVFAYEPIIVCVYDLKDLHVLEPDSTDS